MTSGFFREVDGNCALLGCYAASGGDFVVLTRNFIMSFMGLMFVSGVTASNDIILCYLRDKYPCYMNARKIRPELITLQII